MMVPGKPFPRLSLPAKPRSSTAAAVKASSEPVQEQPYAHVIYELTTAEMRRLGKDGSNAAVLEAVLTRIDDALFRRIATQILRREIVRRVKKIRRKIAEGNV